MAPDAVVQLDDMMMAVVQPGKPRLITFEDWARTMQERIAWNEPFQYECQRQLEQEILEKAAEKAAELQSGTTSSRYSQIIKGLRSVCTVM